jgi:hypothetical protein
VTSCGFRVWIPCPCGRPHAKPCGAPARWIAISPEEKTSARNVSAGAACNDHLWTLYLISRTSIAPILWPGKTTGHVKDHFTAGWPILVSQTQFLVQEE